MDIILMKHLMESSYLLIVRVKDKKNHIIYLFTMEVVINGVRHDFLFLYCPILMVSYPHGTTLSDFCHESAWKESWLRAFTC